MIEGRLVRLRALEPSDAERAYQWINDREVTRHLMTRYPWSLVAERQGQWVLARSYAERAKSLYEEIADRLGISVGTSKSRCRKPSSGSY